MKKIICILFSIVIAFSFSGCQNSELLKNTIQGFIEKDHEPLEEIDLSAFGNITIIDFAIYNDYLAIIYAPFYPDLEDAEAEYDYKAYLTIFNITKSAFSKSVEIDSNAYDAEFTDDKIQIRYDEKAFALYDFDLNNIDSGEKEFTDGCTIAESISTIDKESFICRDSYAYKSNYIHSKLLIFYDDAYKYYVDNTNCRANDLACCDKIIFDYIQSEQGEATLSIKNYQLGTLVNTVTLNAENEYLSIANGAVSDKYAVFDALDGDLGNGKLYCWRYTVNSSDTPFDCVIVDDNAYDEHVDTVCGRIFDEYGIRVDVKANLSESDVFYTCVNNQENAQYLLCLYDLEYCLSTFPKQLYKELLCEDIEDAFKHDRLDIAIVGEINDRSISAFANSNGDRLTTVYSCVMFNYATFCHELMHNLEYRIWSTEPDFDAKWDALNPDGFFYDDNYFDVYNDNEAYRDYFARDYGIKGALEDRATVFEMYCSAEQDNSEPWWTEKEPLNKKVNYLNEVLKKTYPSLTEKMQNEGNG